jgi:hypothetical protein
MNQVMNDESVHHRVQLKHAAYQLLFATGKILRVAALAKVFSHGSIEDALESVAEC